MDDLRVKLNYGAELGNIVGQNIWYILQEKNWLCKMNIDTMEGEYVCKLPYAKAGAFDYKLVCVDENRLLLVPIFSDYVLLYTIENNMFSIVKKYESDNDRKFCYRYRMIKMINNRVLAFPVTDFSILDISANSLELKEHKEWLKCLPNDYGEGIDIWFGYGDTDGHKIMIPCHNLNAIVEISVETGNSRIHYIGESDSRFCQITYDGAYWWVLDYGKQALHKWNEKDGIQKTIILKSEKRTFYDNRNKTQDCCSIIVDNKLLISPTWMDDFFAVDVISGDIEHLGKKPIGAQFLSCTNRLNNNHILFFSLHTNDYADYDIINNAMQMKKFYIKTEVSEPIIDEKICDLRHFIEGIVDL